jgi:hypothetical protein
MLEAIRDFADMPMCNQSLVAFDQRISLRALLVVVSGQADGTPIEPLGAQALAARSLHKLCAITTNTTQLAKLFLERKVSLEDLVGVLVPPLAHKDPQIKWYTPLSRTCESVCHEPAWACACAVDALGCPYARVHSHL